MFFAKIVMRPHQTLFHGTIIPSVRRRLHNFGESLNQHQYRPNFTTYPVIPECRVHTLYPTDLSCNSWIIQPCMNKKVKKGAIFCCSSGDVENV